MLFAEEKVFLFLKPLLNEKRQKGKKMFLFKAVISDIWICTFVNRFCMAVGNNNKILWDANIQSIKDLNSS